MNDISVKNKSNVITSEEKVEETGVEEGEGEEGGHKVVQNEKKDDDDKEEEEVTKKPKTVEEDENINTPITTEKKTNDEDEKEEEEEEEESHIQQEEEEEGGGDKKDKVDDTGVHPPIGRIEHEFIDLASMGWRIGPPLSKQRADQFGNKGMSARVLCRYAYDFDVLTEKPKKASAKYGGGGGKKGRRSNHNHNQQTQQNKRKKASLNDALPSSYRESSSSAF